MATLFIFTSLLEFALVNFLSRREGRQGGLARALWIDCQARWAFPLLWACWVTFYFLAVKHDSSLMEHIITWLLNFIDQESMDAMTIEYGQ